MNDDLALILKESGKSALQLANLLNRRLVALKEPPVSATTPYKWISDGSRPRSSVTNALVTQILSEWTGRRITPADLGWGDKHTLSPLIGPGEPWGVRSFRARLQEELGGAMDRRTYLAQTGFELASLANPWVLDPIDAVADSVSGRRIGLSTVTDIESITAARRRMDDAIGGGALLSAVREDLKVSISLIVKSSYSSETGRRLYAALAEQARLASWLAFDTGQHGLSQHYTATALRAAHAGEARQVGANVLGFAAYQAGVLGDGVAAEQFSRSALNGSRGALTPAVEGSIYARLGMARARLGDLDSAAPAFDKAEDLLARSIAGEEPSWIYWFTPGDLHGIAGESYLAANRLDRAVAHLDQAVAGTPDELTRDKALWLSTRATAHAQDGELERGRQTAEEALELLSGELESERVFGVFSGFIKSLEGHDVRAAKDFRDRLVAHVAEGEQLP